MHLSRDKLGLVLQPDCIIVMGWGCGASTSGTKSKVIILGVNGAPWRQLLRKESENVNILDDIRAAAAAGKHVILLAQLSM